MSFAEPIWLWGLLLVPALAFLEWRGVTKDRLRAARLVSRALWPRVVRRPREAWRVARVVLLAVAAASLVVALARPQWGIIRERIEREGVDVVLVLDTSGSMATADVSPSRFFLARAALSSLVSRLVDDRFALVAFEGEAYPLVPLTLDADAVGLFLETLEPGFVPAPGSSLGEGLAEGLDLFVDPERRNKVLVLVSDGENLQGEVDAAVERAREMGVIVHTVGVGTEQGAPVPDFDDEGRQTGFKKDREGGVVVSRLDAAGLQAIARGTGGEFHRITPVNTTLAPLLAAIEGMEARTLAREFSYRKQERFQVPLAVGLLCLALALLLPPPPLRRGLRLPFEAAAALGIVVLGVGSASAQEPGPAATPELPAEQETGSHVVDEMLLRPRRLTADGLEDYRSGNHPAALEDFEAAARTRPDDPRTRFNLATSLYKNGRYDEAAALLRSLSEKEGLAGPARYNLGNSLFQQQDFPGAIEAYREALRAMPGDEEARRNLELALRALQEQQQQQQQQGEGQDDQEQDQQDQQKAEDQQEQQQQGDQQQQGQEQQSQQRRQPSPKPKPPSREQQERERFQQEAGMPKERAMQLLDALQENEKAEQRKALAAQREQRDAEDDW